MCEQISPLMSDEDIRTCDEIRSVVSAQARFAARVLSTPQAPVFAAFRLVGRDKCSDELVGLAQWSRSRETGELVQTAEIFVACQWEHKERRIAV